MAIHGSELTRLERKVLDIVDRMPRGRVLELAPGSGALAAAMTGLGHRVEALDIHPELIDSSAGILCIHGNLDKPLPFKDESYDLVVCCEGIEHLEFQYGFARELARVLRPGGKLVLTTPNIVNAASRLRFLLTGFYALAIRPSSEFTCKEKEPRQRRANLEILSQLHSGAVFFGRTQIIVAHKGIPTYQDS